MSITITDAALLAQISQASGVVDIQDPNGKLIARMHIEKSSNLPPGFRIPFTEEELAQRSRVRTGRPVGDVIKDLKAKYGE